MIVFEWEGFRLESFRNYTSLSRIIISIKKKNKKPHRRMAEGSIPVVSI